MNPEVARRLNAHNDGYERETGARFRYFLCPILRRDEPVTLGKGHVKPTGLSTSTLPWVVQRRDVDNFYGHAIEGKWLASMCAYDRDINDVLLDPVTRKLVRPRAYDANGEVAYYPMADPSSLPEHYRAMNIVGSGGEQVLFGVRPKSDRRNNDAVVRIHLDGELEFSGVATAALLKAAHLTMFWLLGYRFALSAGGLFTTSILAEYYERHKLSKERTLNDVDAHFGEFAHLIRSFSPNENCKTDTCRDRRILVWTGLSGSDLAFGVTILTGNVMNVVWLPTGDVLALDEYIALKLHGLPDQMLCRWMHVGASQRESIGEPFRICWKATNDRPNYGTCRAT
jgi:hypothetical protein